MGNSYREAEIRRIEDSQGRTYELGPTGLRKTPHDHADMTFGDLSPLDEADHPELRRSAVAASAYRAGECLTNERDGLTHDYTGNRDRACGDRAAPGIIGRMGARSGRFVECGRGRRKNAAMLVWRGEFEIALPHELSRRSVWRPRGPSRSALPIAMARRRLRDPFSQWRNGYPEPSCASDDDGP